MLKIKKRSDGRYVKKILINGRYKYFYGKTAADIDRQILAYQEREYLGRPFAEVASEWSESAFPRLSISSLSGYKLFLKLSTEAFGDTPIGSITRRDIQNIINQYAEGHAQKSVSNYLVCLRQIFCYALDHDDIAVSPCENIRVPKGLKKKKRSFPNGSERQIVIDNRSRSDMGLLFFFALFSGLRKGEILALKWGDIDFDRRLIHVTKSLRFNGNQPVVSPTKTENSIRTVVLLNPLYEELKKNKKDCENYVFGSKNGGPWTKSMYRRKYDKYKRDTGLKKDLHEMRHGFATICFEAGLDAKSTQHLLGHAQISTTLDIYTHFSDEAFNITASKLNEYVS